MNGSVANNWAEAQKMLKEIAFDQPLSKLNNLVGINVGASYGTRVIMWVAPRMGASFLRQLEEQNCPFPIVSLVLHPIEGRRIMIGAVE